MAKRPFDEAKPRTAKGTARERERETVQQMSKLLLVPGETEFAAVLATIYGLKPGEPRYDAALAAWREAKASK